MPKTRLIYVFFYQAHFQGGFSSKVNYNSKPSSLSDMQKHLEKETGKHVSITGHSVMKEADFKILFPEIAL